MSEEPSPSNSKNPRRRRRRRIMSVLGLLILVGGVVLVFALRTPPKVWREHQAYLSQTTPEQRAAVSQGVIDKLEQLAEAVDPADALAQARRHGGANPNARIAFEELDGIDPESTHIDRIVEIDLTNAELSALVATWFTAWAEQRGFVVPDWLERPVVGAFDGELSMAFAVSYDGWSQVIGGPVKLTFRDHGMAEGSVPKVTVGSLPVPAHEVGEALAGEEGGASDDAAQAVGDWAQQLESFEFRPVLELAHRRRARVIAMTVGDGTVSLTVRLQDHQTYRQHNTALAAGLTDVLGSPSAFADVPTQTD
ncbi:MAG: hypothetical protein ACIAXF_03855 [Phycisphaerales bacterium JB063]